MLLKLAKQSLKDRKVSVWLTVFAITISAFVYFSVDYLRGQAKSSFSRSVSGVDLIVGPRAGQLNLLLNCVFRLGSISNSISMDSVEQLQQHPMVTWTIPIALGDSHKGYPVVATNNNYFTHFKYGNKQSLEITGGHNLKEDNHIVLGAEIAAKLGYKLGDKIVLSHGIGVTSFTHHTGFPFEVVGILKQTGTPIDQSLHIHLHGMALMHEEPSAHNKEPSASNKEPSAKNKKPSAHKKEHEHEHEHKEKHGHEHEEHEHSDHESAHGHADHDEEHHEEHQEENQEERKAAHDEHDHSEHGHSNNGHEGHDHDLESVSAVFVGLKAKYATFIVQKYVNEFPAEPIMAVIPGVALTELWQIMGNIENLLVLISILVLVAALVGLSTMLLSSLQARSREIAILRTMGASPWFIFWLLQLEVVLVTVTALLISLGLMLMSTYFAAPWLADHYGIFIEPFVVDSALALDAGVAVVLAMIIGLVPALVAYNKALQASLSK